MKTTVLACLLVSSLFLTAQEFEKGTKLIGGTITGSYNKNSFPASETKSTFVNLSPNYGYFFTPKLAAGVGLSLGLDWQNTEFNQSTESIKINGSSIGFNPFVRYYLINNFFASAFFGVRYQSIKQENSGSGNTIEFNTDITTYTYGGGVGYDYFINDYIAIEASIGYTYADIDQSFSGSRSSLALNVGLQIFLDRVSVTE